jgi:hypothetical protein
MANIRTLKLNLLADTTDFASGIKKASGQTESFSSSVKSSMKTLAKSAALAGVAVAGMAVAFGVDAVKAAIEDEKSQRRLAKALKNTTGATNAQVKAIEDYISKTSISKAIVDDKLRPAFQRLVQATKDTTKAQDLLNLAIDISAGTGKDLELVANTLGKAYGGNLASLQRLGVGLDKATIKTGDFAKAKQVLDKTFGGQGEAAAKSFEGRLKSFNISISESKEAIGGAILESIQPFADKWLPKIAKGVEDVIAGFEGKSGKGSGIALGESIRKVTDALGKFFEVFTADATGQTKTAAENVQALADALDNVAKGINAVAGAVKIGKSIIGFFPKLKKALGGVDLKEIEGTTKEPAQKPAGKLALGGVVSNRKSYLVGEHGPELFTPMGGGTITPNSRLGGGGVTIIMNGIVDGESARRSIERVLQQSSIRTGAVNVNGALL